MELGNFRINDDSFSFDFVRAAGPGGQHVNKTSTAVVLRFKLYESGLNEGIINRFAKKFAKRMTSEGEIVIKAMNHRSQIRNREEAFARLEGMIAEAAVKPKYRVATKPSKAAKARRVEGKKRRSDVKKGRGRVDY